MLCARYTDEATRIGAYTIPKGVFVYVLFHHLHNSPKLWDQPDQFWPERWEHEDGNYYPSAMQQASSTHKAQNEPPSPAVPIEVKVKAGEAADHSITTAAAPYKKFLPFSDGPHSCPAQVCNRWLREDMSHGMLWRKACTGDVLPRLYDQ